MMTQRFKVHEKAYPYFITSTVVYWLPIFCRDDYFRILQDSLLYCYQNKGLLIYAFVLMPNHFHLVCSQSDERLSEVIADMKGFTSRQITKKLQADSRNVWLRAMRSAGGNQAEFKLWQDEFHPEQVYSQEFFEQKLRYIHNNPVRAGYVNDPSEWKYSSAGFYYKDREPIIPIASLMW